MPTQDLVLVQGPGYYNMGEAQYHADPAPKPSLSASIATILVTDTAADAKYAHPRLTPYESLPPAEQLLRDKRAEEKAFDVGNVAHFLLLGKGKELEVITGFDDWKKKEAQERRKEAFANGLQPCLEKTFDQGEAMGAACLQQIREDPDNFDAFDPAAGESEVVALWQEQTAPGKMWMRAMLDRRMNDRRRIYDYKTFAPGADPDGFVKYLFREGRDLQDPFYSRGMAALEGCEWDDIAFRWIVQSPKPPYILSTIDLMHDREMENSPRRFAYDRSQWAIDEWARNAATRAWSGYVPRTYSAGVPGYAQTAWELRRQQHEAGLRLLAAGQ